MADAESPTILLSGHSHAALDLRDGSTRRIFPGSVVRAEEFTVALLYLIADKLRFSGLVPGVLVNPLEETAKGKSMNKIEQPDYPHYANLLRAEWPEFAAFTGIEHVLTWMQNRGLMGRGVDIVGQDEFSYDFLVELETGGCWLAFGVT